MIGVFDSGIGGLTVLRALCARFPLQRFVYLADHANAPYGDRPAAEIVALTQAGVETLFEHGCRLVVLGCNTATAIAARHLQQAWLPVSRWRGHNVLGIVAPTVEAATQTPWAVTTPQYPQKFRTDTIAVFGTTRTVRSSVYVEEIRKRCPKVRVVQEACAGLAGGIESAAPSALLEDLVATHVARLLEACTTDGAPPDQAILGCTHYPLVEGLFRRHLPPATRLLSQPDIVADSLEDYLSRKPWFAADDLQRAEPGLEVLTTGDPVRAAETATVFWPEAPPFTRVGKPSNLQNR